MIPSTAEQPLAPIPADDEIDLRKVVGALGRRWRSIAGCSAIGLALSGFYLLNSKPVYQGEFQIVLNQENKQSGVAALLGQSPGLEALVGLSGSGGNDPIATEVEILNSPSVLRPVFDAVKARKPPEEAKKMRFGDWAKENVTAEEEKGTSVLNVEFRDADKQLVLPITQMISEAYQSYSNRGRARELSNLITYLNEQINIIKPQARAALPSTMAMPMASAYWTVCLWPGSLRVLASAKDQGPSCPPKGAASKPPAPPPSRR